MGCDLPCSMGVAWDAVGVDFVVFELFLGIFGLFLKDCLFVCLCPFAG